MRQRQWLQLSRKLVSRYDLEFTIKGMSDALNQYALDFFGEGVLNTTRYPNPFPITMSATLLGGTVGNGIAYDPSGAQTGIGLADQTGSPNFTIPTADTTYPRWDLLVIEYVAVGDTPVPKPSDPITTVDLNLHDDFLLKIIPGTPSATPAYPIKGTSDIILAGIQVPANATLGTTCSVDLSIREFGIADTNKYPFFKKEIPSGAVNGSNVTFVLSEMPLTNGSVFLFIDGDIERQSIDYSIVGKTITTVVAPAFAQDIYVIYIVDFNSSQNPLTGLQETPIGVVDGINDTFNIITGTPADKGSTFVYVDGEIEEETHWSIIFAPTGASIKFLPAYIPAPSQTVYVTFFVNPATVGTGSGGGGGGGGGAYTVYGSISTPIVISPTVGITANNNQRQLQFVTSPGGAQIVTCNPQVSPGTIIGQEMLLRGVSNASYITLNDGNGLSLNGSVNLTANESLKITWDGITWFEEGRV